MTSIQKIAACVLAALLLVGGTAWGIKHHAAAKGVKAEAQAATFGAEAKVETTHAQASDAKVPALVAQQAADHDRALAAEKTVAQLQAERVVLLKRLAARPVPAVDPGSPPVADVRDDVIAKDAEVIAAQATQVVSLKAENADQALVIVQLTTSRDEWHAACDLRDKQATAQAAATQAWKEAVTAIRWQGRIEGFALGALAGYLGGKK